MVATLSPLPRGTAVTQGGASVIAPSALRGLGRHAYRLGTPATGAAVHADRAIGRTLCAEERKHVCDGYFAERAEVEL